ncbi:YihY/virulence factor BrkB family protein [Salinispirillum marinum]|uniref:YihY/virulence factor BrkB family protein n=2 Tax=Saccharospirillaceae TaxID=255527 RepID=A0ABV8BF58_9GAMM
MKYPYGFQRLLLVGPNLRYWLSIARLAAINWLETKAFIYAAALAFFTLFSLAPVMIVLVTLTGVVFGESAAEGQVLAYLTSFVGADAALLIQNAVLGARLDRGGWLPTLIGLGVIIVGATTVFAHLQQSLNAIWDVVPKPSRSGMVVYLRQRLFSLVIVLSIGILLMASLLLSVLVQALLNYADQWVEVPESGIVGVELLGSMVVISVMFAAVFKVLPDVFLSWRDVLPAGLLTALLFMLGRYFMARYLTNTAVGSAYGAAGSLVLLLVWVQYSALVLLYGAAFCRAHLEARGGRVRPNHGAAYVRRHIE